MKNASEKDQKYSLKILANDPSKPSLACLPNEVIEKLGFNLEAQSLISLINSCAAGRFILEKPLFRRQSEALLRSTMQGQPEQVKKILALVKQNRGKLIVTQIAAIEPCSRSWQAISPIEYAAWAGDEEILYTLLHYLLNVTSDKKYLSIAIKQMQGVLNDGIENRTHLEPYNFLLRQYDNFIGAYQELDTNAKNNIWRNIIGTAQYYLPVIGLQWICDGYPYDDYQDISCFKRTPKRDAFVTVDCMGDTSLLPIEKCKLGEDFALHRAEFKAAAVTLTAGYPTIEALEEDQEADFPHLLDTVAYSIPQMISNFCRAQIESLSQIIQKLLIHQQCPNYKEINCVI